MEEKSSLPEIEKMKNQGNQYFQAEDFSKAAEEYERAIQEIKILDQEQKDVKNLQCILYTNMAVSQYKLKNYKLTKSFSQKALNIDQYKFKAVYHQSLSLWYLSLKQQDDCKDGTIRSQTQNIILSFLKDKILEPQKLTQVEQNSVQHILQVIFYGYKDHLQTMIQVLENKIVLKVSEQFTLEVCDILDRFTIDREMEGKNYVDTSSQDDEQDKLFKQQLMASLQARNTMFIQRQQKFVEFGGEKVVKNLSQSTNKKIIHFNKEFQLTVEAVKDPMNPKKYQQSLKESQQRFLNDAKKAGVDLSKVQTFSM